jgi:hypothetical protein
MIGNGTIIRGVVTGVDHLGDPISAAVIALNPSSSKLIQFIGDSTAQYAFAGTAYQFFDNCQLDVVDGDALVLADESYFQFKCCSLGLNSGGAIISETVGSAQVDIVSSVIYRQAGADSIMAGCVADNTNKILPATGFCFVQDDLIYSDGTDLYSVKTLMEAQTPI